MKQLLSKILAFHLALIVLLSSFSFYVKEHFCEDELVDVSYFGEELSCDDEHEKEVVCCSADTPTTKTKIVEEDCCSEEVSLISNSNILSELNNKLEKESNFLLLPTTFSFISNVKERLQKNTFHFYKEIVFKKHLYTWFESYLI